MNPTLIRQDLSHWNDALKRHSVLEPYHYALKRFWHFICTTTVLKELGSRLCSSGRARDGVNKIMQVLSGAAVSITPQDIQFESEEEQVALYYLLIEMCAEKEFVNRPPGHNVLRTASLLGCPDLATSDKLGFFSQIVVEPVIHYFGTSLHGKNVILSLLIDYKHRCEWFDRELLTSVEENEQEWGLKLNLYKYLHEKGVEVSIDPYSDIGKPDLIGSQTGDERLVADAKVYRRPHSKGIKSVVHGFHQVYKYCCSYNEPVGYLIIFKTCDEDVKIEGDGKVLSVSSLGHSHKTIYFLIVDIYPNPTQASKRGKLKHVIIAREQIIEQLNKSEGS